MDACTAHCAAPLAVHAKCRECCCSGFDLLLVGEAVFNMFNMCMR